MMNGCLLVQSYAARQSAPVPGVTVTIRGEGHAPVTLTTDETGTAPVIQLPAPDKALSLDEANTQQPYSLWDVTAEKEGYQTVIMQGVQVFACQTALILLEMLPAQRLGAPQPKPESFDIPPHSLYRPQGPSSVAPAQNCPAPLVLPTPIVPTTITVHLGKPKESARNVTVSFRHYIANVASSEVYPTWPEQALRANIHAQISLAMNRIFTEWYPSRGYTFNITNSTSYDQYYVHGRNIFEVMEKLTDDIFNTYVRRQGTIEPYYTEYCDGKSVTCKGMKQWGTVDRANEGKNALQILKYYYGNDIEIVRTNNLQNLPESYPGTPLRKGDSGQNVRIIQRQLTRIAKDYPFFGKPGTDGVFGAATEATVKAFQKQFSLTADGVVGRSTWYKISYVNCTKCKIPFQWRFRPYGGQSAMQPGIHGKRVSQHLTVNEKAPEISDAFSFAVRFSKTIVFENSKILLATTHLQKENNLKTALKIKLSKMTLIENGGYFYEDWICPGFNRSTKLVSPNRRAARIWCGRTLYRENDWHQSQPPRT